MKKIKFLKYIFILLLFVLFILLFKRFILKEGNVNQLIEQAQMYRTKADENYSQSQQYHLLGDEAEKYAKNFLNQATFAESSAHVERDLKTNQQNQASSDELIRMDNEERQRNIIYDEEFQRQQNANLQQNKIDAVKNRLLEAEMRDKSITQMTIDLGLELETLYNRILATQNEADELNRRANMAKERNQENWIKLSNELKNQEMYLRITLDDLVNKYTIDNQRVHQAYGHAQNAHSDFLIIQQELSNLTI